MPKAIRSKRAIAGAAKDFGLLRSASGAAVAYALRRPVDSAAIFVAAASILIILVNALFLQSGRHPAPMLRAHPRPGIAVETTGAFGRMIPRPRPAALAPAMSPEPLIPAPPRSQADNIALIQQELAVRGFYDAAADGLWGPKTDAAVRAFLERAGIRVPVEPGEALLRQIRQSPLRAAPAVAAAPSATAPAAAPTAAAPTAAVPAATAPADTLSAADAALPSPRLMAVQRALADFGYGQINPTGIEDAQTRAAIAAFERERNLPPTGRLSDQLVRELATMTGRPLE